MAGPERDLYAGGTRISWADYTFNPWRGCVKVSPACRFCYAETSTNRWGGNFWGKNAPRPVTTSTWRDPRKWDRQAAADGVMRRVFSGSLCDVFEDRPDLAAPRERLFDLIESTTWLIWMLLTKRPENIAALAGRYAQGWPPNVWLGCTAETQRFADERLAHLRRHDVAVRFVSAEPLLGPVVLPAGAVNWVITGGESGTQPGVRLSHPAWYGSLRDQALAQGIPYHHKQNGMWVAKGQLEVVPSQFGGHDWYDNPHRHRMLAADGQRIKVGEWTGAEDPGLDWRHMIRMPHKEASGRLLDGRVWDQVPVMTRA
jgi:protein gp37